MRAPPGSAFKYQKSKSHTTVKDTVLEAMAAQSLAILIILNSSLSADAKLQSRFKGVETIAV
jgi:hypothetical protein